MLFKIEVSYYKPTLDIDTRKQKTGSVFTQETHFIYLPQHAAFYDEVKRVAITPETYLERAIKPEYGDAVASFTVKRLK
jgi:hypothetical protein